MSKKSKLLRDTSPVDAEMLGAAEEQLEEAPPMPPFYEEATSPAGWRAPDELEEPYNDLPGADIATSPAGWQAPELDPVVVLPVAEITASLLSEEQAVVEVKKWMEQQPDPVPRMSDEKLTQRIRICERWVGRCPKQAGSDAAHNWGLYVDGMLVASYLAHPNVAGGRRRARRDLSWDVEHGHIWLQNPNEWALEQAAVPAGWKEVES